MIDKIIGNWHTSRMKNEQRDKIVQELFVCDCGDIHHQMVVTIDTDPDWRMACVEVKLNRNLPFWKRICVAFRYLFGKKPSIYGDFDEIILSYKDADRLQKIVDILRTMNNPENTKSARGERQ